jgi:hypothetical protein
MTSGRSIGSALVLFACCLAMMASTASATIPAPPGGPILVVTPSGGSSNYLPEILRSEGLNDFDRADIGSVSAATLAAHDVVVLADMTLTTDQVGMFTDWVIAGGNLIAMHPRANLAPLLGLSGPSSSTPAAGGYLRVNTSTGPGAGITNEVIQYHGSADNYTLNGATAIANLWSGASSPTGNPAVSLRDVGANGGQAAAFSYDLASSVIQTRQGNPAWIGQDRDGSAPIRSNDLFFGGAQPDWLDLNKAAIPQADEQQRLLVNLITEMARTPMPRFWYLPNGLKTALVLTGDDHGRDGGSGTATRFAHDVAAKPSCSAAELANWDCVRSTSYTYPDSGLTAADAAHYRALGFEIALHLHVTGSSNDCNNFASLNSLEGDLDSQLTQFQSAFPAAGAPVSGRTHCIVWSDWDGMAQAELDHGIRLDTNYYYWPGTWVGDRPGLFTGSGFPQRFANADGSLIDIYQSTTQLNDELYNDAAQSLQTELNSLQVLLGNALNDNPGYYGVITANNHNDLGVVPGGDAVEARARSLGVKVISSEQLLNWLDGRNASAFQGVAFNGGQLTFNIAQASGAHGLQAMLPINGSTGALQGLSRNGAPVATSTRTVKGIAYAVFDAQSGSYVATYPAPGAGAGGGGGSTGATGTGSTPSKGGSGSTGNSATNPAKAPTFPKVRVNVKTFRLGGGRVFTVSFKAKKTAKFTLVMTNAKGKVVRTLNAGRKTKGKTVTFKWNGRDKHGKRVSAGTYRFKVTALAGKTKQTVKGSVKVIAPKT